MAVGRFAHSAGILVPDGNSLGAVDRPEAADEGAISTAQANLCIAIGLVSFLRAEDVAHGVAHRDKGIDDVRVLAWDPLFFRASDGDFGRIAVNNLM